VTPILNDSSLEESFAWFEKLGWRKHWDFGDPPDFGAVLCGDAEIFLCPNCTKSWSRGRPRICHGTSGSATSGILTGIP
jgi:hypothetical protein